MFEGCAGCAGCADAWVAAPAPDRSASAAPAHNSLRALGILRETYGAIGGSLLPRSGPGGDADRL
ncbi:hypothetical protein GCM10010446_08260 [Streptomyces enissocaesilis]|uniref:Uncharacterized protein n=1 Tax=Streptomyces enissocaesilis TaxID=332589 RepID=A0ABP6JCN7_9ACTN